MAGYAHYSKSAGVLLILGTIAAALSLPPPPPLVPLVLGVAVLYTMIKVGLYLGRAEGLGAPLLDSLFSAGALKPPSWPTLRRMSYCTSWVQVLSEAKAAVDLPFAAAAPPFWIWPARIV